jgi:hypothetical protein
LSRLIGCPVALLWKAYVGCANGDIETDMCTAFAFAKACQALPRVPPSKHRGHRLPG